MKYIKAFYVYITEKKSFFELAIFLLPIIFILFIFRQSVSGNMFNNGDVVYNLYNYFLYYLNGGDVVTQNILSGFPVLSSVAAIWFYPVNNFVASLLSPLYAYSVLNVFNIILAYIFSFLFFKRVGVSYFASIFSSVVFIFSGQLMVWVGLLTNTNYYFLLPLSLLLVDITLVKTGWKKALLIMGVGFSFGVGWLSGHVQYIFYIHTFVAMYWFYWQSWSDFKQVVKRIFEIISAFMVSFIVGYPQIISILDIRPVSVRESGVRLSDFWEGAFLPQDFIHYFLPFFKIAFVPFSNPNLYIAILPLFVLVIGSLFWKELNSQKFKFFLWTYVFCIVVSIKYSPFGIVLHSLPFFDSFREAPRIMFIGNFALAALSGFFLDYIINNKEKIKATVDKVLLISKKFFVYLFVPLIAIATLIELFFFDSLVNLLTDYFIKYKYGGTSGLPLEHYTSLIVNSLRELFEQVTVLHSAALIFVIFCLLSFFLLRRLQVLSSNVFYSLSIILILFNFAVVYEGYYLYVSKSEYKKPPSILEELKRLPNLESGARYRLYSIFPGQTRFREIDLRCGSDDPKESFLLNKEMLLPDINMDFGVDVLAGYDNFMPKKISELLDLVGSEQSVTGGSLAEKDMNTEEKIETLIERKSLLKMMNVRFVISRYDINDKDFKAINKWEVGDCKTPLTLYELSNYWPRYFITNNVAVSSDEGLEVFTKKVLEDKQNYPKIYFNSDTSLLSSKSKNFFFTSVDAAYGYDSMTFNTSAESDSYLYLGNAYLPNWSAYIDGVETRIFEANYAYMSVFVPKGSHEIVFKYEIPGFLPFLK